MSENKINPKPNSKIKVKSVEELDSGLKAKEKKELKGNVAEDPHILQIGSLYFKTSSQTKPLVWCKYDIPIQTLVRQVINNRWELTNPKIVVVILSNAGPIHNWNNENQIKSFQKGLMKAAENTEMWLITNGMDIGSTTIIGDAVSNYITEAKYKKPKNNEKTVSKFNFIGVIDESQMKDWPTLGKSDELIIEVPEGNYGLNPNLTHYIAVKDESLNKDGVNRILKDLVLFLSLNQRAGIGGIGGTDETANSKDDLNSIETNEVPVVSIVIKGGYECSRLVLHQIKNRLPVVLLRGSGGLADLLAFVDNEIRDRCLNQWNSEFAETYLKPELTIRIIEMFPKLRNNSLICNTFRNRILETIRESRKEGLNYLTIINMFDNYSCNLDNLTEYLLLALFKSQRTERLDSVSSHLKSEREAKPSATLIRKDLSLCVDWNCLEVAKKEVLSKDPTFVINNEKDLFEESLIRSNRWQFVDLFLSQKFKLKDFVTPTQMRQMFRKIHFRHFFSTVCWEGILGKTADIAQSETFIEKEFNWLLEACTGIKKFVDEKELTFDNELYPYSEKEAERKALEVTVFWALLDFRKRLVRILWKHSDQPIHLALIIAMSYDRLSWYVSDKGLSDDLKQESKQFASYACAVLESVYKDSVVRAEQVLNESPKDWNYKTPVDLAAFGKFRSFLSHLSCQRWLTNQIYGNITVKEVRFGILRLPLMVKLLMSAYLVFPMYLWIKVGKYRSLEKKEFSEDMNRKKSKTNYKSMESLSEMNTKPNLRSNDQSRKGSESFVVNGSEPPLRTLIYETWNAPITKFWNFQFFYICYLSTFSVAVLYPKCGHFYLDLVVCVWTALIIADLIRQSYLIHKLYSNYSVFARIIEITFQIVFLMLYIFGRLIPSSEPFIDPYTQKIILCMALLHAFYILLTVFLPISATLGPLLFRLRIMILVDFLNFIRLSILVMISFGVVLQAILYPDLSLNTQLFRRLFHRAFLSMFVTFADELSEEKTCDQFRWINSNKSYLLNDMKCSGSDYSNEECRVTGLWPYIFEILYLILLRVILMTLLYAIFASSATRLTADTDSIWKFQRYGLVMDFVTRAPLPPPINIFYYVYRFIYWNYKLIRDRKTGIWSLYSLKPETQKQSNLLEDDDYMYMKILASEVFSEQENRLSLESLATIQWERIKANSEELEYERRSLRQLKGKLSEMERFVRQSIVYLESIKHLTTRQSGIESIGKKSLHILSRHSPYPNTTVQRFPVPDKYVSWDVMWIEYDPIAYTKLKDDFSPALKDFADQDLLVLQNDLLADPSEQLKQNLPVFKWNSMSISGAGITIDRQSWEMHNNENILYKLDHGIPVNPFGRTGLKGRGALLRWGPNHYVMAVITRKTTDTLEVLVERTDIKMNAISLILRFIPGECTYIGIEKLFPLSDSEHKNWTQSEKMINYFQSFVKTNDETIDGSDELNDKPKESSFTFELLLKGYFDDPLNTDQAWKEIELWHFHYNLPNEAITNAIASDSTEWREVTESFFSVLTLSQSNVIQVIADKLKFSIH